MATKSTTPKQVLCIDASDTQIKLPDYDQDFDSHEPRKYKSQPTLVEGEVYEVLSIDEEFVAVKGFPYEFWGRWRFEILDASHPNSRT